MCGRACCTATGTIPTASAATTPAWPNCITSIWISAGAAPDGRAVLVLNGWVDWADGSTFLAATQAQRDLVFPYLQVKDAQGQWKTVIDDMGMPSGKPKTIAVDLTGKFLSASREVRIVTNLCVYWDEIFLIEENARAAGAPHRHPHAVGRSALPRFLARQIRSPAQATGSLRLRLVDASSMWNPTPGNYTRYGDVLPLSAPATTAW